MSSATGTVTMLAVGMIVPLMLAGAAQAAEIHAIVTGALTAPFRQIVPAFERATGNKLDISYDGGCVDAAVWSWLVRRDRIKRIKT